MRGIMIHRTARPVLAMFAAGMLFSTGGSSQTAVPAAAVADVAEARSAFMRHDFDGARRILEAALAAGLDARDAAEAHRRLAVLAWRFRGEVDVARVHLERAVALPAGRSESLSALARLELHLNRPGAAWAAAQTALQAATSGADTIRAVTRLAEAATHDVRAGRWPDATTGPWAAEISQRLRYVVAANPGVLDVARLELLIALLQDDGSTALSAWDAYYSGAVGRPGPLRAARAALDRVLPEWAGASAPVADRRAAVHALAASGHFDAALALVHDPRVAPAQRVDGEPEIAALVAYIEFTRRAASLTDEYYRRTAAGDGDAAAYRAAFFEEARRLWPRLHWPDGMPPFRDDDRGAAAWEELASRFGALVNLGETAGTFDLHYGHRVIDEERTVEQYGHTGRLRFISLDGLVSNGYQTWAWDGESAHGGWGRPDLIVQVRPAYAGGGPAAWRVLHEMVDAEEQHNREEAELERARREPCAYLPGLRDRLRRQGLEQIRDSLRLAGLEGDALRSAFLAEFEDATVESSIFAHEGRHAIDQRLGITDAAELEFRGKLSEVAFARFPRLALRAILSPSMGDATPHGRANARVICGVVDWLTANPPPELDPSQPVLPQLTRLSDDQLRTALRALDVMAH
jgi:hypothetical protein